MHYFSRLLLLLALMVPTAYVAAQAQSNLQGTIDRVMMDDGFIVINGKQLVVRAADLVITYQGEPIRSSFLTEGLTVFYSTRADGSVSEITLIGPANILGQFGNE